MKVQRTSLAVAEGRKVAEPARLISRVASVIQGQWQRFNHDPLFPLYVVFSIWALLFLLVIVINLAG